MFSSSANAAGGASSGMASLVSFTPLLLIFFIFYLLMIRPQQQAVKQHCAPMLGAVKKGDEVVTGGGLIGKVTKVDEDEVELEFAQRVQRPGHQVDAERRPPARRQSRERLIRCSIFPAGKCSASASILAFGMLLAIPSLLPRDRVNRIGLGFPQRITSISASISPAAAICCSRRTPTTSPSSALDAMEETIRRATARAPTRRSRSATSRPPAAS